MRTIDFFDKGASIYPENLAFVEPNSEYTYQQASVVSHHIASAIIGHGYEKGSKIGILAPNCNLAFLALLGLMRAEAIWLPINPRNSVTANIEILERFDGELLFYHSSFETEANEIKAKVANINTIICLDSDAGVGQSLNSWINNYQQQYPATVEQDGDIFAIFPTGGTTGKPKGVVINHKNIETLFSNYWEAFNYADNSRHLVVAPMTHSAGVLGCAHFARGGTNYMMAVANPEGILKAVEEYKITHYFIPPTVLYMMLVLPNVKDFDQSSLQHLFIGAAPTSLEKLKEAINVFGPVLTEAFGQTEAPASITVKAPKDYLDEQGNVIESRLSSIGRPAAYNKVAILDNDGKEVARGERGEICVQGNLVTSGYYKNPVATKEVHILGWLHTGDIGVMDHEGFIKIVDRKKDLIITGGFNVFPNEIEQVLNSHPAIQDCAVIGIPDEKWGESVKAVVQLKANVALTKEDLIRFTKAKLDSVKAPKSVDFVENLPRSPVGKVLKKDIRAQYWSGLNRSVN